MDANFSCNRSRVYILRLSAFQLDCSGNFTDCKNGGGFTLSLLARFNDDNPSAETTMQAFTYNDKENNQKEVWFKTLFLFMISRCRNPVF